MSNRVTIDKAAEFLGVSTKTLRRWEEAGFFVPEREPSTNTRLYHPIALEFWKNLLNTRRILEEHLKKLDSIKKELVKHLVMKPLQSGERLPMLNINEYKKADDAMEEWEKEYDKLNKKILSFPRLMLKAVYEMEESDNK